MQQHISNKTKVSQERDLRSDVQIRKKTEESSSVLAHDYNPLENVTCKIGDNACAAKHVSVIQRTGLFHPMNESQKVQSLLRLQQQYGNRFVQRVIAQHAIQTKLKIGQPGDKYEQEADRVADAVLRMPEPQVPQQAEEEDELLQAQLFAKQITPLVQRQVEEEEKRILQVKEVPGQPTEVAPELESHIHSLTGGGQVLAESTRAFFEPRFDHDFSQVQMHTGTQAAELARAVNARAFTVNRDVVFGADQYAPETREGRWLLAHELAHVIQQSHSELTPALNRVETPGWVKEALDRAKEYAKRLYKEKVQDLQSQIDRIADKAQHGEELTIKEVAFLKCLYWAIVVGGYLKGYPEAAQLLRRYLSGSGKELEISSKIYQKSEVVQTEIERQKSLIRQDAKDGKLDKSELSSKLLFASYERLKAADNRFILKSKNTLLDDSVYTVYRVNNTYNFTGFETGYWTDLTLWGETVKLPDGLSKYLVDIRLAKEFDYYAVWEETWSLSEKTGD